MEPRSLRIISAYSIIVLIFSFLAACVAFAITYNEFVHHYASKREPLKHARDNAIATFIVFLLLGGAGVLVLNWLS